MVTKKLLVLLIAANLLKVTRGRIYLNWTSQYPALDRKIYENAVDSKQCENQLRYIINNPLLEIEFIDAGLRIPRSVMTGNRFDLGNYKQCLEIDKTVNKMQIQGKYCFIKIELDEEKLLKYNIPKEWLFDEEKLLEQMKISNNVKNAWKLLSERRPKDSPTKFSKGLHVAVCIPKTCSLDRGLRSLMFNFSNIGIKVKEEYCRFANDKPWTAVDTVALVILTVICLLSLLSTAYEICQRSLFETDSNDINKIIQSFSLYRNTNSLIRIETKPETLECLDGIRAMSIAWVILGHSYVAVPKPKLNAIQSFEWYQSLGSTWVYTGTLACDTFFLLSGILLVYTNAVKFTSLKLLKNLHHFYLNRILRMFPLLAAAILFQISIWHHISDGPDWRTVAKETNNCRTYWWLTLLYVQNYFNPMCLTHSWYLAVDMQLYILSPLVLLWVFSEKRKFAWMILSVAILLSITVAAIYSYLNNFPAYLFIIARLNDLEDYFSNYYINTLTRAPPYFVGMFCGYVLHVFRGKLLSISLILHGILWTCSIAFISFAIFIHRQLFVTLDYDNQNLNNFINSFVRPIWAFGVSLLVFECVHGYGGFVNWLLSHNVWKVPSRISYAMYLFHPGIMKVFNGMNISVIYFSNALAVEKFIIYIVLSFAIGFLVTVFIGQPVFNILNIIFITGSQRSRKITKIDDGVDNNGFIDTAICGEEYIKEKNNSI